MTETVQTFSLKKASIVASNGMELKLGSKSMNA